MPELEEAAANAADAPAATPSPAPANAAARGPLIPAHLLDPDALKVIRHLRRTGFKAYLVGGCVRDLLLGHRPKDFDVATSAHPHQVKETFRNCRLIGRRFRLAHVYFRGGKVIEVSTFRSNPLDALVDQVEEKQDLLIRHDNVFGTEEEDARRRDFTINGLFYDLDEGKVVDYVGGMADLAARSVRTIGNPDVRMREDPVRILRAIRFAAKCDLSFDPETFSAMKAHAPEIPRCAPPRVLEELMKLTRCGKAMRCLTLMREVGVLKILLPPISAVFEQHPESFERQLRALAALDAHVCADPPEIPSDAVLLSALLAPLPRSGTSLGPIPKAAPAAGSETAGAAAEGAESAPGEEESDADELDPELEALNRRLAEEGASDEEGEGDDSDEKGDDGSDEADADDASDDATDAPGDPASAASEASISAAPEGTSPEGSSPLHGDAASTGVAPASSGEASIAEAPHVSAAQAEAAVHAPLPSAALRSLGDLHDERLAAAGIPTFSLGGESAPWTLPRGVVPPETVLSEMVRTARLPRRIAERARLILSVQGILAGDRKRRRFSPAQFARESIFPEALAIFELNAAATGQGIDQLARWQSIFLGQPVAELQVEPPPGADRPRRRRRGGRGRRGGGRS